ncbi:hypothetical protein N7523_007619 [Penicillium sp. IBT 18751x]|nr:hypothetical protein N7523_007619 [Penicillium sp. IBT 18751x]
MAPQKRFRKHALQLIEVALKWLSDTSNVSNVEIEELKETLEQVKASAAWEPYDISQLRDPEDFPEFLNFIGECPLLFGTGRLLIFTESDRALEYLELAHDGSTKAEALVRARLDIILTMVLGFAKENGRIIWQNSVSWGYETPFWKTIRMKSREKMLRGQPDYALWYGAQANLETNLLIVEAKTPDELGKGERQLLGYMGLVHAGRIERGKADTTVYGISTDSIRFNFYRISQSGKWCSKTLIWGFSSEDNEAIVCVLLQIMALASSQSPMHTREPTSHDRQFSSSAGEDATMADC